MTGVGCDVEVQDCMGSPGGKGGGAARHDAGDVASEGGLAAEPWMSRVKAEAGMEAETVMAAAEGPVSRPETAELEVMRAAVSRVVEVCDVAVEEGPAAR
jgi:hypothetical protein